MRDNWDHQHLLSGEQSPATSKQGYERKGDVRGGREEDETEWALVGCFRSGLHGDWGEQRENWVEPL